MGATAHPVSRKAKEEAVGIGSFKLAICGCPNHSEKPSTQRRRRPTTLPQQVKSHSALTRQSLLRYAKPVRVF